MGLRNLLFILVHDLLAIEIQVLSPKQTIVLNSNFNDKLVMVRIGMMNFPPHANS